MAWGPHGLLIADTYNDRLRRLDLEGGVVESWFGGEARENTKLSQPAGLVQLAGGQVVVADTNRHRVLIVDAERCTAKTLPLDSISEEGQGAAYP